MRAFLLQSIKSSRCRFTGIALLLAGAAGFALACDTPVYRYAMYRWEPAAYEVYYFHDKPLDEPAAQVQKLVQAAAQSEEKPANLFFVPVSLSDDPELKKIPPDVRKVWQDQKDRPVPSYMVVTPHGRKLYQGALDESILKALLGSPVRDDIAKQLAAGKAGVLVLVSGSDAAANDAAEKVTKELISEVAAGKVELYLPPGMAEAGADAAEGDTENTPPSLQLGFSKITRTDPAEKWLVDSLISMEEDLSNEEFAGQPMIFAVFGRGRALPPFVGKGITRDNLLECVYFLTGACSCTVKDQNPGMDLLFAENWWAMAEKLASTFGAEEGNETQLGAAQLFPHLMIPGGQQVADAPKDPADSAKPAKPSADPAPAAKSKTESAETTKAKSPAEKAGEAAETKPAEVKQQAKEPAKEQPEKQTAEVLKDKSATEPGAEASGPALHSAQALATPASSPATEPARAGHASAATDSHTAAVDGIGIFAVGAGLCVALVLLFGATFLVMRPK